MSRAGATFQEMVESWFLDWLMGHRGLSGKTVESYRDAFRLLVGWLKDERGVDPEGITYDDVGHDAVVAFLDHLRDARGCSAKTVNCRLCAIKSFASYVACECPERSAWAKGISSVKRRKEARPALDFLTPEEVRAVADACDPATPEGRRDSMMVMLMFNAGFRVSETVELRASSFEFGEGSYRVTTVGKGRKERSVPIWDETSRAVAAYMAEFGIAGGDFLFPGRNVSHQHSSGYALKHIAGRTGFSPTRSGAPTPLRRSTRSSSPQSSTGSTSAPTWNGHSPRYPMTPVLRSPGASTDTCRGPKTSPRIVA